MRKSIDWTQNPLGVSTKQSMSARVAAANQNTEALRKAEALLIKYTPLMTALLETRLKNRTPLKITKSLVYETSDLLGAEADDGFYVQKSENVSSKFVDLRVEIPVGETLIFKSLYAPMREFIFEDSKGREHAISFDQRNLLMTHTDIYHVVKRFIGE